MAKVMRIGVATVGLAGALAACGGDAATDDAATTRADAFVPPGIDAGPIDANEPPDPDAFGVTSDDAPISPPPDAPIMAPDAFMGGADDCMLTGFPALSLVDVAAGHDWTRPVYLTHPPGSTDLYVVDARGLIFIVRAGAVNATPFFDMRSTIGALGGGGDERGLLGLAFHPDYATNGRFFVGYTPLSGDNWVAEGRRSAGTPDVADSALTTLIQVADFAGTPHGRMVELWPAGPL